MSTEVSPLAAGQQPTRVRYGVLGLACSLAMITYLDRVCFGSVAGYIKTEFHLDDLQRGMLFAAFTFAYSAFEIPTGWLGDIFGPRKTLIRIVLWWSFFTALTGLIWPIDGWLLLSFWALVAVRFCFGMGEAGAFPNIARAFHNWFPFEERGFAQGAVWMAGRFMGGATPLVVNSLLITAVAVDGTTMVHWRHIFWCFGILGLAWCAVFWWWFRDRPDQNPSVNSAELALIRAGMQLKAASHHAGVPWRRILGSGNLWFLCAAYFCSSYGWYFNITYLPDYLEKVYGINRVTDRVSAGLLTGAPLLCGSLACLVGGVLTDTFIRRTGNRKWGRRLFGVVGKGTCSLCWFATLFAPNVYVFVLAISLASFCNDMTMGAAWASCLDIGRKYSGIVSGCMNTIGNFGGVTANILTGMVLKKFVDDPDLAWQINFISFACVYAFAVGCWLLFDSTKVLVDED
jgi:MFS transporter, ACS family, glucarate transporter